MSKSVIRSDKAAKPVSAYSQAIKAGNLIFVAGQIALKPNGDKVTGDVKAQTRQVLENIKGILEDAGSSLDKVVKTTIYLTSLNDYAAMNEVYSEYFKANPPARATIEISKLVGGFTVEIEAIALA